MDHFVIIFLAWIRFYSFFKTNEGIFNQFLLLCSGIYAVGNFRFITDSFSYSNSVARYDDDDANGEGRYIGMKFTRYRFPSLAIENLH
jgi:hypothetical protein